MDAAMMHARGSHRAGGSVPHMRPISEEGESAANRLQPRAAGVLLVHLCRARGLPATDLASGSIYPFIRMKARTHKHKNTHIHKRIAKITFSRFAPLPASADAYRPPRAACHAGFRPGGRG